MNRWFAIFCLLLALPSFAVVLRHENNLVIGADQVINDDLVVSGNSVQILGRVTGDLVVAGGNVDARGPVGGDVIVAGGTANIAGPVSGSLYAAGGTVILSSTVGRNAVIAGGTVNCEHGAKITRDLAIQAGNATLAGTVGRDVLASAGGLLLTNTARVNRDLIATTPTKAPVAAGAVIGGRQVIEQPVHARGRHHRPWRRLFGSLFFGISLLLV